MIRPKTVSPSANYVFALLLALGGAPHADAAGPATLSERLQRALAGVPRSTAVALVVVDTESGADVFAHQPDVLLKPASVQKLFVTAAALDRFGPGFEFQTQVYLHGDQLWVVGSGDPGFGDERLEDRSKRSLDQLFDEWAEVLRAHGVTTLSRIVLDDSVFDDEVRHPDWPANQADRWYQAPVGGLNINDNCLDATVILRGADIALKLRPEIPPSALDNKLRRGKKQAPVIKRAPGSDVIQVAGTVATGGPFEPVCVHQPTLFFAQAVKQSLARRGVTVQGDVVRRALAAGELASAALIATHTTSLPDVLWRCNTFSQNMFAECLMKALAAYEPDGSRSGMAGSWERGRVELQGALARLGVDVTGATFRDGSGLSHQNVVTAAQLARLLVRMRHHRHADVFLQSLAEPGKLGSMQRRFDDPALRGRMRGKTGTLAGVHALAGYITRGDGTVVAFALLINGPGDGGLAVQVCKILAGADDANGRR